MRFYRSAHLLGTLVTLATLSCTHDGSGIPRDDTGVRMVRETPSFREDILTMFDRRGCSQTACHGATSAVPLTAPLAYDHLVGVVATAEPVLRVRPGDPAASYLVQRLEGTQVVGSRMPLGGAPVDSIDLTNVRRWILQGARRN